MDIDTYKHGWAARIHDGRRIDFSVILQTLLSTHEGLLIWAFVNVTALAGAEYLFPVQSVRVGLLPGIWQSSFSFNWGSGHFTIMAVPRRLFLKLSRLLLAHFMRDNHRTGADADAWRPRK